MATPMVVSSGHRLAPLWPGGSASNACALHLGTAVALPICPGGNLKAKLRASAGGASGSAVWFSATVVVNWYGCEPARLSIPPPISSGTRLYSSTPNGTTRFPFDPDRLMARNGGRFAAAHFGVVFTAGSRARVLDLHPQFECFIGTACSGLLELNDRRIGRTRDRSHVDFAIFAASSVATGSFPSPSGQKSSCGVVPSIATDKPAGKVAEIVDRTRCLSIADVRRLDHDRAFTAAGQHRRPDARGQMPPRHTRFATSRGERRRRRPNQADRREDHHNPTSTMIRLIGGSPCSTSSLCPPDRRTAVPVSHTPPAYA